MFILESSAALAIYVPSGLAYFYRAPCICGGVFWLPMVSFALYNALIDYLLTHREKVGLRSLVGYEIAVSLHFLINDYSLYEDHKRAYSR